jgi:hypothetical protein
VGDPAVITKNEAVRSKEYFLSQLLNIGVFGDQDARMIRYQYFKRLSRKDDFKRLTELMTELRDLGFFTDEQLTEKMTMVKEHYLELE